MIEKLAIIQELKAGQSSRVEVAKKHNLSVTTLVKWRHRYEQGAVYQSSGTNRHCSLLSCPRS
ncbi:helix-turn-helix domain-containing protein [Paenibacillus sp. SYP-B3998]|uniref:Helix-turn-helix domain-containing protein n=1 Tax=Paenibacillus sp. SYP-B3998 TaxID=2678564 RepID=A0A6G4A537_9BACL|nr:helix-turn-helix domain-containing protein [Paenibacillus sp. SYP-B3998]